MRPGRFHRKASSDWLTPFFISTKKTLKRQKLKKSFLPLLVLGSFASLAQAQSTVTLYGFMDIGFQQSTGSPFQIVRNNANGVGFKGSEDLGGGLSAMFDISQRFLPDTGANEGTVEKPRALYQGRTIVGLKGNFGSIKIGRSVAALQATIGDFEPFENYLGVANIGDAQYPNGYVSGTAPGNGGRFSNGVFYDSPAIGGFTFGASLGTKENDNAGAAPLTAHPYSLSLSYANGALAANVGTERNTIGDKWSAMGLSYKLGDVNLMASVAKVAGNSGVDARGWTLGSKIDVGAGTFKIGYSRETIDNAPTNKVFAVGYQHTVTKRTYFYADVARKKTDGKERINGIDAGIHHTF
jgi:predicted porin